MIYTCTKEFNSLSISRSLEPSVGDLSPYLVLPMRPEQTSHQHHLDDAHRENDGHLQNGPPLHTGKVTVHGVSMAGLSRFEVLLIGDHLHQSIANTVQFILPFFWRERRIREREGRERYVWERERTWMREWRGEEGEKKEGCGWSLGMARGKMTEQGEWGKKRGTHIIMLNGRNVHK